MRIEDLSSQNLGDRRRIEARIVYEDADLPPLRLFYEAGPPLAEALEATPEAFVLPAFPIALWEGERRIEVEGKLDTTFAAGLGEATSLLAAWYEHCGSLTLEPKRGFHALRPRSGPRAVALFTGGVDAMAMLFENRRLVPLDHPHSIRNVVCAFGFHPLDFREGKEVARRRARYEVQARRAEALGRRVGFTVTRLDTNVVDLYPSPVPFYQAGHSAAFLAPLIASPSHVSDALIASDGKGGIVAPPHGAHPLLDVHYSTGAVRVHHVQAQMTRTEKLGLIADWELAYDTLHVCHGELAGPPQMPNCGRCEKCVRTMVGLIVWSALPRFTAFPRDDVTPEMIDALRLREEHTFLTMPDLLAGLERVGRDDLLRAIQAQVARVTESRWGGLKRRTRRAIRKRLQHLRHAPSP